MTTTKQARKRSENTDKNTDIKLVVPAHGRGALRTGGNPGNKGGTGRPPSKVRKLCREAFEVGIPMITAIRDDEDQRTSDRLKAHELLGRFGGVAELSLTVDEQPEEVLTPDQARKRIETAWERIERVKSVEALEELVTEAAKEQVASGLGQGRVADA